MRVLVTGAGGFIGSHLVRALKEEGHYVIGVDLKYPLRAATAADQFQICDLREPVYLDVDRIFHLAADVGGIKYISKHHAQIARNNTLIDLNTFEAARQANANVIYISSTLAGVTPGYGVQKAYGEQLARYYAEDYGLSIRVVRLTNVYGPWALWEGERAHGLMALCRKVAQANDGDEIEVWGDGTQTRDFMYVSDVVEALISSNCQVVETGRLTSVNELVRIISGIAGKSVTIRNDISKPMGYSIDTKMETWRPRVSLEEGVKKTYEWVRDQCMLEVTV